MPQPRGAMVLIGRVAVLTAAAVAWCATAPVAATDSFIDLDAASGEASKKIAEMTALSSGSLGVVHDGNFDRLVRSAYRPYHTFVLFNARDAAYQCALCGPFDDEVVVLAESYWRQRGKDSTGSVPLIYFVRADISNSRRTFTEYNIQSAPLLVHFPPTGATAHPKNKFPPSSQYASELDAENAALFVRERTEYKVEVYRSPWARIITAVITLASVAVGLYFMRGHLGAIIGVLQSQTWLWLLAGIGIYYVAVSGVLYDIIRGVPPFGYDPRTKKLILFAQSSGTQYVAEGLIIGGFNIGAALCAIILCRVLPKMRDERSRSMAAIVAGLGVIFFFYQVYNCYHYKNQWYSISTLLRS